MFNVTDHDIKCLLKITAIKILSCNQFNTFKLMLTSANTIQFEQSFEFDSNQIRLNGSSIQLFQSTITTPQYVKRSSLTTTKESKSKS